MQDKDVHTEHCCIRHGCKYCDDDCTVTTGRAKQSFPCEYCSWEAEEQKPIVEALEKAAVEVERLWSENGSITCTEVCAAIRSQKPKLLEID